MSTAAKVIIKVKPEYKGLLKFTIRTWNRNRDINNRNVDENIEFMCNGDYLGSYINHDGYLDGVGWGLYYELPDDYKKIFMYILQGDRTSFESPYYRCDETYEENKPGVSDEIPDKGAFDYFYMYNEWEPGIWSWRYHKYKETEWKSLDEAFKEKVKNLKKYDELIIENV